MSQRKMEFLQFDELVCLLPYSKMCLWLWRCSFGKTLSKSPLKNSLFLRKTHDNPKMMNYVFRATALQLQLHGDRNLEKKMSKRVDLFYSIYQGYNPNQNQGVHMDDQPIAGKLLHLKTFS